MLKRLPTISGQLDNSRIWRYTSGHYEADILIVVPASVETDQEGIRFNIFMTKLSLVQLTQKRWWSQ